MMVQIRYGEEQRRSIDKHFSSPNTKINKKTSLSPHLVFPNNNNYYKQLTCEDEHIVEKEKNNGYRTPKAPRKLKKIMNTAKRFKIFGSKRKSHKLQKYSMGSTKTETDFATSSSEDVDGNSETSFSNFSRKANINTVEKTEINSLTKGASKIPDSNLADKSFSQMNVTGKEITRDVNRNNSSDESFKKCSSSKTSDKIALFDEATNAENILRVTDTKPIIPQPNQQGNEPISDAMLIKKQYNMQSKEAGKIELENFLYNKKSIECLEGDGGKTIVSELTTSPMASLSFLHSKALTPTCVTSEGKPKSQTHCCPYADHDLPNAVFPRVSKPKVQRLLKLLGINPMTHTTKSDNSSSSDSSDETTSEKNINIKEVNINPLLQLRSTSSLSISQSDSDDSAETQISEDLDYTTKQSTTPRHIERLQPIRNGIVGIYEKISDCLIPIIESPPAQLEKKLSDDKDDKTLNNYYSL